MIYEPGFGFHFFVANIHFFVKNLRLTLCNQYKKENYLYLTQVVCPLCVRTRVPPIEVLVLFRWFFLFLLLLLSPTLLCMSLRFNSRDPRCVCCRRGFDGLAGWTYRLSNTLQRLQMLEFIYTRFFNFSYTLPKPTIATQTPEEWRENKIHDIDKGLFPRKNLSTTFKCNFYVWIGKNKSIVC